MNSDLLSLPFDQFQRYQAVAETANILRGKDRLKVLDVGGYPGVITRFLADDETHIVDIEPSDQENYHQASGTELPFPDNTFDLVTAVDTYEHVLKEERRGFLSELFRVSKDHVILIGPFASEPVEIAEQFIFDFSLKTLGSDFADSHPLKEHIAFGLPDLAETLTAFTDAGLVCQTFPSGHLYNWLILNFVKHFLFTIPKSDSLHQSIDYYYNKYFYEDDKKDPAYRTMIVGTASVHKRVLEKIAKTYHSGPKASEAETAFRLEFFGFLVNLFDLGAKRELNEVKKINLDLAEQLDRVYAEKEALKEALASSSDVAMKKNVQTNEQDKRLEQLTEEVAAKAAELEKVNERIARIESSAIYKIFGGHIGGRR